MIRKEIFILLIIIQILVIGWLVDIAWGAFSYPNTLIDISMIVVLVAIFLFWGHFLILQIKNLLK